VFAQPDAQMQVKPLTPSLQVAPFWQGFEAHSLMLVWQKAPEKPGAQAQE
jgi:hypothetical protein